MNARLTINDYDELVAVHRALLELKTISNPNDEAVIGSPLVAQFAHRLLDTIIEADRERVGNDSASRWNSWRLLDESRREWGLIANQIANVDNWDRMSSEQRREYITNVASPFKLSEAQLDSLVDIGGLDNV